MSRLERLLVWGSIAAVSLTGLVYAVMKYLLHPVDEFAVVNHPLQPLVLKLHILAAPFLVFAIGLISLRHIWPHLQNRVRHGRRSGVAAALVVVPMTLTGYLVQAVTHVGLLTALAWSHLVLGCIFALAAAAHALMGRGRRAGREGADEFSRFRRDPRSHPGSADETGGQWRARASSRTGR